MPVWQALFLSFLKLALNEVLDLVHLLLLLVQEVHDNTHGRLLYAHPLNFVLDPVLHVAQSERGMDHTHCKTEDRGLVLFVNKWLSNWVDFTNIKWSYKLLISRGWTEASSLFLVSWMPIGWCQPLKVVMLLHSNQSTGGPLGKGSHSVPSQPASQFQHKAVAFAHLITNH